MLAVVLAAGALASCGGGDDDEQPLTRDQFMKRATFICNEGEREREEAIAKAMQRFEEGENEGGAQEAQRQAVLMIANSYEQMTNKLADLSPPAADEKEIEAIISAMEDSAARVKSNPEDAIRGAGVFGQPNKLVSKYGLESCRA